MGGRDEVGVLSGRLEASADALCEGLELIAVLLLSAYLIKVLSFW